MFDYFRIKAAARRMMLEDKGKIDWISSFKCSNCKNAARIFVSGDLTGRWCWRCETILGVMKRTLLKTSKGLSSHQL